MDEDSGIEGRVVEGKYQLVRRVGDGTPACYEVTHPRLVGRFAAKLWPSTVDSDAVRYGAEIAMTLRHPGLVQLIDFNCEPGMPPFVVTEWVAGTKLSDLLAQGTPMAVDRVAAIAENAAAALASAHRQGIVHEELRPEDISLVTVPGIGGEGTKLDGLGVASAMARSGSWPASPYHAPEQNLPDGAAPNSQSDQYALAAIVYQMLSGGVLPFSDHTSKVLEAPRSLMELAPAVTPSMDLVIRQALAPDPATRFSGVLEFARALRNTTPGANTALMPLRRTANPLSRAFQRLKEGPRATALTRAGLVAAAVVLAAGGGGVALRRTANNGTAPLRNAVATVPAPAIAPHLPTPEPPPAAVEAPMATADLKPAVAQAGDAASPPVLAVRRVRLPRSGGRRVASASRTARSGATGGSGLCLITVESKPAAQVWLDGRSTGRRTPLTGYRVPCGTHKLALKRSDLHLSRVDSISASASAPFRQTYRLR
jgi:Protein kinase domain/PEGA domain